MKELYLMLFMLYSGITSFSQLLQQDFQSSTTVANYVNATPGNTQFTQIASTLTSSVSAASNRLDFTRVSSGVANFVRSVGFSTSPTSLMVRFDVSVSGNSVGNTTQGELFLGTTTTGVSSFADNTTAPLNGNTYAKIGIGWTTTAGSWFMRDITNTATGGTYTGTNTALWVVNKSGGSLSYRAPNGTNESIANNTADVWVGTTREFNDVGVATTTITAIDKTKFIFSGANGTMSIDNMLYDPIPITPISNPITAIGETTFIADWLTVAGVTGYRIDVATDAAFASPVTGYNNLYVAGQATNAVNVTGLNPGTIYYFRVRGASQYAVDEFASGNSNVRSSSTFSLALTLKNFRGYLINNTAKLTWSTDSEKNTRSFEIERSRNGRDFIGIGKVNSIGDSTEIEYSFTDNVPIEGKGFYRLNMVRVDGKADYSSIVLINNQLNFKVDVYPNPVSEHLTVQYRKAGNNSEIRIINAEGRKIKSWPVAMNSIEMKLLINDLANGNYFLVYDDGQQKVATRFIKK